MNEDLKLSVAIAESAPVIQSGFSGCIRKMHEFRPHVYEITDKEALISLLRTTHIDLLIVNPTFGGILNPEELRQQSRNDGIKIYAIELGKLSGQVLSFYDDHLHVTDDIEEIKEKVRKTFSIPDNIPEEKETLSTREKEIVSYVVKGFTNQEIADKLFLSIHTVITHRRNIARKLEIHSATGLTIYAIVNKIVDLSDIKL